MRIIAGKKNKILLLKNDELKTRVIFIAVYQRTLKSLPFIDLRWETSTVPKQTRPNDVVFSGLLSFVYLISTLLSFIILFKQKNILASSMAWANRQVARVCICHLPIYCFNTAKLIDTLSSSFSSFIYLQFFFFSILRNLIQKTNKKPFVSIIIFI